MSSGPLFPFSGRLCPDCERVMEDDDAATAHARATGHRTAWTAVGWQHNITIVFGEDETYQLEPPTSD